ncbi:Phytoene dehydrogenase and related proteins [Rhodococcus wratislaviensis]|uniref:Phytoene dehydrogenase and related proteins n=1 Tax=Rhodococcus wratislaviensis TaxID=44752 RepID=A0A402CCQ0_RHOWR|nr:Phytoene dehydrogenase and related proteins [Rhodococcus wratislaviensis]
MHADTPVDAPGSGVMGYLLTMLAQDDGYVVPVGGAGALSAAMAERARRRRTGPLRRRGDLDRGQWGSGHPRSDGGR